MKVNKEVFDLARKMDYMGYSINDRRRIIKDCLNPIGIFLFGENPLTKQLKDSYKFIKELEEKENVYEEVFKEMKYEHPIN